MNPLSALKIVTILGCLMVVAAIYGMYDEARADTLDEINNRWNAIPGKTDQQIWGREDYWATPDEIRRVNAADCEDYALAKLLDLLKAGYPADKLYVAYVRTRSEAHMVLAYYQTDDPLILDNLNPKVFPHRSGRIYTWSTLSTATACVSIPTNSTRSGPITGDERTSDPY